MLQPIRSRMEQSLMRTCRRYLLTACRDLDLARERIAGEESAAWLERHAPMAASFSDRFALLEHSLDAVRVDGLICEFGVYRGATINYLAARLPGKTFHGFDSFAGLPESWRPGFDKGSFRQEQLPRVRSNVRLHNGLFDDSLPVFLMDNKEAVSFLHIDCDLHSSAKLVLDLLADRIVPGTIIQFDEFLNYPGWRLGEQKAFSEFCADWDVSVEYLGYVSRDQQLAVRISAIGKRCHKPVQAPALAGVAG